MTEEPQTRRTWYRFWCSPGGTLAGWMAIGAGVGAAVGTGMDAVASGLAVGIAGGALLWFAIRERRGNRLRPDS